jgi:hypothetical protein
MVDKLVQRGLSTLELMVAMGVLTLVFSATLMILPGLQSNSLDTIMAQEALQVAKGMLEKAEADARYDFRLVVGTTSSETVNKTVYTKELIASTTDFLTRKVTAKVSWGGMFGRSQNVTLTSLVSNFDDALSSDTCDSVVYADENFSSVSATHRKLGLDVLNDSSGLYPISDIDVLKEKMYVAVNGSTVTPAARNGTTFSNDASIGSVSWINTANASANDSSYAQSTLSSTNQSNYIKARGFGFTIPKGATILGITASIDRSRSGSGGLNNNIIDNSVRIIKADGTIGTQNKAQGTQWPSSDAVVTYGSQNDLWGETWTASNINDSDFGIALSARGSTALGGARTARVDHITVTVTYIMQFYPLSLANPLSPAYIADIVTASGLSPVSAGFTSVAVATSTTAGAYAYVSTNSTTQHIQVIDVSTAPTTIVNTFALPNMSASSKALTVFYKNGYLYVGTSNNTSGPELYVLDVHNPITIPAPIETFEVGAGVNDVYVHANQIYLGTDDVNREALVLDASNIFSLVQQTYFNPNASAPGHGKSLFTVGNTLYFGQYFTATAPEFTVLGVTTTPATLISSRDISASDGNAGVYDVIVRDHLAFLLTGTQANGNARFVVVNTRGTPSEVSRTNLPNNGAPIALDCERKRFYAASVPLMGGETNKGVISIISAP